MKISDRKSQVVWYSHLFQNFPQLIVIHTVKGFGIVNKADVFLELSCFFDDPADVGNCYGGIFICQKKNEKFTEDMGYACVYRRVCDLMIREL